MNKTFSSWLKAVLIASTATAILCGTASARNAAARAPAGATFDACSWDRPGVDPFMGDVIAAVDRYQDIAPDVRERLKARMVKRAYDDVVSIRRDSITGRAKVRYGSAIRDMHFGSSKVCRSVSRAAWSAQMHERGLVYCDSGQCILIPTICRNVSRIARAEVANERAEGDDAEPAVPPVAMLDVLPAPIPFDVAPESPSLDASGGGDGPVDGVRSFGGVAGAGAVAAGSFASGATGGHGASTIASVGKDESPDPTVVPHGDPQVGVQVTPVPEPETWGLMVGGLVALGAWRRRRR